MFELAARNKSWTQVPADMVTFTEEILNGKLHFLCSVGKQKNSHGSSFLLMDLNEEPTGLIISGSVE